MRDPDVESFNDRAESYDAGVLARCFHGPIQQRLVRIATRLAPAPRAILDVGCGTGAVLALFAARCPAAALCGIDPATEMLRVAQARLSRDPRVQLRTARAEQLPFDDGVFDLVVSSNSFHHWADQPAGIREIGRVLAPGGYLVMTDPFAIGWRRWGARIRPHGRMRSQAEMEAMLDAAGLATTGWERAGVVGFLASYFLIGAARTAPSATHAATPQQTLQ